MSFFGRLTDLVTGQAAGTTDASAAQGAAADAQLKALDQADLDSGKITQDQYNTEISNIDDEAYTDSPTDIAVVTAAAGIQGAAEAATDPVQVVETGLDWEASTAGTVAGSAVKAASDAAKTAAGSFFSKIPWWVYPVVVIGLFLYLGGGGFLERKARARFSR